MTIHERAEARLQAALETSGARDPRSYYREQLRLLKDVDPAAFRSGATYYEETLIPAVAAEDSDPLREWLEYGRYLATLRAEGRTVQIDPTGRASDYAPPVGSDQLVLHLPTSGREPAIPVGLPRSLSAPQRATFELLVRQKVSR